MIKILHGLIQKLSLYFQGKMKLTKLFRKDRNNPQLLRKLERLQNRLNNSIDFSKHSHYLRMASIKEHSKKFKSILKKPLK